TADPEGQSATCCEALLLVMVFLRFENRASISIHQSRTSPPRARKVPPRRKRLERAAGLGRDLPHLTELREALKELWTGRLRLKRRIEQPFERRAAICELATVLSYSRRA